MPRKTKKTEKQPLRFLERPVGEARVQIIPDVRAAINPKDFFSETQRHNGSSLNSWVCRPYLVFMPFTVSQHQDHLMFT